jgi:hypothetical protein
VVIVRPAALVAAALALACARAPAAEKRGAQPTSVAAPDAAPSGDAAAAAAAPGLTGRCGELFRDYEARRAAGGRCARDADCGCYPDISVSGLRRTSDAATAKALTKLTTAFRQINCPSACATGPPKPRCPAACKAGRCELLGPP